MRWQVVEHTCGAGPSDNAGVLPPGFVAGDLIYELDGKVWLNGHQGAASGVGEDGKVSLLCSDGMGNEFPPGTRITAAAGYPPKAGASGKPLRWETFDVTCPSTQLPKGIAPGFVVASYTTEVDGVWFIAPASGWNAHYRESGGELLVPCGGGNDHGPGTHVRVALGYLDDDAPELEWVTHAFTCPADAGLVEVASDVRTDFATSTFSVRVASSKEWRLSTMFGLSSKIEDGKLMVDCGGGNGLGAGAEVLIGFGYR